MTKVPAHSRNLGKEFHIILANAPFGPVSRPSIAIGCLAASLREQGFEVRCVYPNIAFADLLGYREYCWISNHLLYDLAGEWIFAKAAFPDAERNDDAYFLGHCRDVDRDRMERYREMAGEFVENTAKEIAAQKPALVGCTTGFTQTCASLALLRRIRELCPDAATILGGSACEGDMGRVLHANSPYLDYVFSGEADLAFPELCRRIREKEPVGVNGWNTPGLYTPGDREADYGRAVGREMVGDLSVLPEPEYAEYFEAYAKSRCNAEFTPGLLMETSRGCWWGEREACAFCGLNGMAMKYRRKKPELARRQIVAVAGRYRTDSLEFTDNMLAMDYFHEVFPALADERLTFHYEVSPTLSRRQLAALSDAGGRWLQGGLESMLDNVLELFNKGNRVVHNIRFLKWARELGIYAIWSFLYNVPGENPDWYREAVELIPLLTHLQPPALANTPLRIDRFSRYHREPEKWGLKLRPFSAYRHVFPYSGADIEGLAYYFEREDDPAADFSKLPAHMQKLTTVILEWKWLFRSVYPLRHPDGSWTEPPLLAWTVDASGRSEIVDTRPAKTADSHCLTPIQTAVYDLCDGGADVGEILSGLEKKGVTGLSAGEVEAVVAGFSAARVMATVSGKHLALAIRQPCRPYYSMNKRPGGGVARRDADPRTVSVAKAYGF